MKEYKFTVFTPCFNGAETIFRVFESMRNQTYDNWEWIIINDGSTDESDKVINDFIQIIGKEKIKYIIQDNKGKHLAWNRAICLATGDFFVPADCDDSFVPETLEFFNEKANELRGEEFGRSDLSGISVCCFDPQTGDIIGTSYPEDGIISDDIELKYRFQVKGEKWGCVRVDLLKRRLFPEIKSKFYCEDYLWYYFPLVGYRKANYNKKIRAYYYEPKSLTNNLDFRLSPDMAAMFVDYSWWKLRKAGPVIWKYSVTGYLRLYFDFFRSLLKWAILAVFKKGKSIFLL